MACASAGGASDASAIRRTAGPRHPPAIRTRPSLRSHDGARRAPLARLYQRDHVDARRQHVPQADDVEPRIEPEQIAMYNATTRQIDDIERCVAASAQS